MPVPILKTAFAGLGLLRAKPGLAGGLALLQLASYLALAVLPLLLGASPETLAQGGARLSLLGLQTLLLLASHSIAACAVLRAALRPAEQGVFGLKLGLDELRMTALVLLIGGGLTALALLGWFVAYLLTGRGQNTAQDGFIALGLNAVTIIPVLVWIALAGPRSFDVRRLALPSSVKMVRGVYWPITGAMAITLVTSVVIYFVTLVTFGMVGTLSSFETEFTKVWLIDYRDVIGIFTPARMVLWSLGAIAGTITTLMWIGLGASVYRRLNETTPQQRAEVFA